MRVLDILSFVAAVACVARPVIGQSTAACSGTLQGNASAGDPYWLQNIKHQGLAAFNPSPSSYQVFRNVKDFGAVGDGVADDTAAIKYDSAYAVSPCLLIFHSSSNAISTGNRCGGGGCDSTTTSPAIVYFPKGCVRRIFTIFTCFGMISETHADIFAELTRSPARSCRFLSAQPTP